ncbi:hypothetical protein Pint_32368 [Pistacia integerrima]|uniref:Uncharacterized protein n=1 Tax=Pistacia integerrima TaxID=434235 RepID=A0ACC0XQB1_9ROSI|nr:hypothetical protein Pint_32368 [Pistacia integerrima]
MGRQLQREHSGLQFESYHPGCLWSILHILDNHQWRNVKRIIPNKKHLRGRKAICFGNPKTISLERESGEAQNFLDADNFIVEQDTTTNSIEKHSGKASIKALISEEMSKEENHKQLILGFPAQSKLQRTYSIHHLDPSDFRPGKISDDWTNPIIVLHKDENTSSTRSRVSSLKKRTRKLIARNKKRDVGDSVNVEDSLGQYQLSGKQDKVMENSKIQKQIGTKQLSREILHHQVKEYVDVLEIFKVNKEEFLKLLKEPDIAVSENFPGQQISNKNVKLTKSGSFPVADSSRIRYLRPSTLEHKQNETWAFPKGEMPVCSTEVTNPDSARSQKGYNSKTVPSLGDDNVGSAIKQKANNCSQGSSQVSSHQPWNKLVKGHFRGIKRRLRHAIKEKQKENDHSKTDAKQMPTGSENISVGDDGTDSSRMCHERDGSDHDLSKSRRRHMRRTTSLNESLEKYARLFESSSSREAKLPHSNSLKLRNEDKTSSREHAPKFFKRISSLSDLESFSSLLNELANESEMPVSTEVDCNTNTESDNRDETKSSSLPVATDKLEPLDAIVETQFQKSTEQGSDSDVGIEHSGGLMVDKIGEEISMTGEFGENIIDALKVGSIPPQDQEIDSTMNPSVCLDQPSPDPVTETCFPDNILDPAEVPISEGSELNPVHIHIHEADSSFNLENRSNADSLLGLCDRVNTDEDNHFLHFELGNNDASFNYVREVLHLSGFIGNECLGTWYSLDQPLNPSVFKELEEYLHHELQYSPEEIGGNCEHQLLFDLINEVLLELYERSFTYFPRAFSFNSHIRPMPKGNRVLDEVWSRICRYLSFRTNLDQSLDDIVAQDLAKGDGWLTQQFETECVVLELEDLICDELFDELIYS